VARIGGSGSAVRRNRRRFDGSPSRSPAQVSHRTHNTEGGAPLGNRLAPALRGWKSDIRVMEEWGNGEVCSDLSRETGGISPGSRGWYDICILLPSEWEARRRSPTTQSAPGPESGWLPRGSHPFSHLFPPNAPSRISRPGGGRSDRPRFERNPPSTVYSRVVLPTVVIAPVPSARVRSCESLARAHPSTKGVIQLRGRKARRAPQLDLEEARRTSYPEGTSKERRRCDRAALPAQPKSHGLRSDPSTKVV